MTSNRNADRFPESSTERWRCLHPRSLSQWKFAFVCFCSISQLNGLHFCLRSVFTFIFQGHRKVALYVSPWQTITSVKIKWTKTSPAKTKNFQTFFHRIPKSWKWRRLNGCPFLCHQSLLAHFTTRPSTIGSEVLSRSLVTDPTDFSIANDTFRSEVKKLSLLDTQDNMTPNYPIFTNCTIQCEDCFKWNVVLKRPNSASRWVEKNFFLQNLSLLYLFHFVFIDSQFFWEGIKRYGHFFTPIPVYLFFKVVCFQVPNKMFSCFCFPW